jgi:hypothetical protein
MKLNPGQAPGHLAAVALFVLGMTGAPSVTAQQTAAPLRQQIVGTWELVSVALERDGKKLETFGPSPKGMISYDANGNYVYALMRNDLPKVASNNRLEPTPEESKAMATGVLAAYGTYGFNDADGTMTMRIDSSTFPNFNGADQKRVVTINGDELRVVNPTPPAGGGTAYLVWRRAK